MMRRFANAGRSLGSGMSGLYSNRRGIASGMQNILGTAKSGIRLLGRTNEFVNRMGVSPGLNSFTQNMEQYGNPSIDFANDELSNVR
jgi:hypothetical protein